MRYEGYGREDIFWFGEEGEGVMWGIILEVSC